MGLQPLTYIPPANYSIKYYYPTGNILQVSDASVAWNHQDGNGAIFLANNGSPHTLVTNIKNSGNLAFGPVTVNGKIKDMLNVQYVTSNAFTGALNPGQNQLVSFPNLYTPTTTGTRFL